MKPTPQAIHLPTSLLQNPAFEPLQILLKPYSGITHVPDELGSGNEATLVFIELNKCFKKAGYVAEGLLANIIWGFEQCGFDPRAVAVGLTQVRKLGYIQYSDARGNPIYETDFDPNKPIWIRYTQKMKNLFVKSLSLT